MKGRPAQVLGIVAVVFVVIFSSMTVSAAVATDSETRYNGSQSESDQAIEVRYTVSPDGGTINNMTVDFDGTDQTFIESNSFSFTVSPGGANVDIESRSGDRYFIQELESDEEVTFVFNVYPKTIKENEIDAVSVQMNYIQNGQDLTDTDSVAANISSSPWFALQTAQEQIEQQESQLQQVSTVDQLTNISFLATLLIGIVGILAGVYSWRKRSSDIEELKWDHADDIESLAQQMDKETDKVTLLEEAEEIRDEVNNPGSADDFDDF